MGRGKLQRGVEPIIIFQNLPVLPMYVHNQNAFLFNIHHDMFIPSPVNPIHHGIFFKPEASHIGLDLEIGFKNS
jgi:hypothetical protein